MTNPKAKTAAREFLDGESIEFEDDYSIDSCANNLAKILETYADSVAEERVLKAQMSNNDLVFEVNRKARDEGFRAGQGRMRERAAKVGFDACSCELEDNECPVPVKIRSLGVEEK